MRRLKLITRILVVMWCFISVTKAQAQTDMTNKITNSSFETGNLTGWTWTGADGYAWLGPNTDGDNTKNGSYIGGIWNSSIGDCKLSQTITGLSAGYYQVRCLMTVTNNNDNCITTQRLFAESDGTTKSQLYGAETEPAYSETNLAILGSSESYTFAGNKTSKAENGPFCDVAVVKQVTNGTLTLGIKVNGKASTLGYNFSYTSRGDAGFFKFDHFRLYEVSKVATLDNIALSEGTLDEPFTAADTIYTATLPVGTTQVTPLVKLSADGATVSGNQTVDVSSGSGTSIIVVRSIDSTTTKTYTINYTVLDQAPETVVSFQSDSAGVSFKLVIGILRVQVCNNDIIRVSYCQKDTLPKGNPITVNKTWQLPSFTVVETDSTVTVATSSLNIVVKKVNSMVSFYNKSGNLILSEYTKSVEPVTITQYSLYTNTCSATFNSPTDEALYGLGQHQQGIMNYKGKNQTLDQQNGEIALPFLVSNKGYGILWDNYSLSEFSGNISANTRYAFSSESGNMVDYYFIYGQTMDGIISGYRTATGSAPLFPKWAYGLFQSKDKYSTADELLKMGNDYRKARIPLDCIVQDWDYWTPDLWGSNTVNKTRYPDPKATIDSMHNMNLHTMISIWPVFHKDCKNYKEYSDIGALYPSYGSHHFYDPHNPAARDIYWNQVNSQIFSNHGWDAWWADNDEPQGWPDGFDRKDFTTALGSGVTYYNTYPITHVSGVYEGWRKDITEKRAFILSRSAFSGQQRYGAASWSGDIQSNWTDFKHQLSAGLNFCLSGIPYWTTDIGGYFGTDWSTADNNELMVRWFQYGTFTPIYRIHGKGDKSMVSTQNLSANTIQVMTKFDQLRYKLMPYIYSLAWKVTNENYTIMRHLIMEYQDDANVKNIDDQFFFGPFMMINPVTSLGQRNRNVYLPTGEWYDFWTGSKIAGGQTLSVDVPLDQIPIYVKAGSIIPVGPEIQHANAISDPIELRVYRGADGQFSLYEDAGDNYNYENGSYTTIPLTYNDALQQLTIGARKGSYPGMLDSHTFKIVWVSNQYGVGINQPVVCDTTVQYNGSKVIVSYNASFIPPKLHYEAEDATLEGNAVINNTHKYFSGTGYVEGMNLAKTSAVKFQVEVPNQGIYRVKLRYSAGYNTKKQALTLVVNNKKIQTQKLDFTRDLNTWGDISCIVPLVSGANTIKFGGDSTFVNLDCIDIMLPDPTAYFQTTNKTFHIRPLNNELYLASFSGGLHLAPKDTTNNQLWEIVQVGENINKITSLDNGESVTVDQSSTVDGATITTSVYNASASQKWYIDNLGSGVYLLTASHSNLVMGATAEGALEQQTDAGGGAQRWILEEVLTAINAVALYEPFNYDLDKEVNGLGESGNGWGSSWVLFEGASANMKISQPTDYAPLATDGNKLEGNLVTGEAMRAYRLFYPKFEDNGNAIWLSFLMQINNPAALTDSWQGISLFSGNDERIMIGKDWAKSNIGYNGFNVGSVVSSTSAFNGEQNWFVFKIETSGDTENENACLWINPDPTTEPNIDSADVTSPVQINSGIDKIVCHLGNTAGISCSFDEIRLGYSFSQVSKPYVGITIKPSEKSNKSFNMTYNYGSKRLTISTNSFYDSKAQLKVINMNGVVCYNQIVQFCRGNQNQIVEMKNKLHLPGIYLCTLTSNSETGSLKIVW